MIAAVEASQDRRGVPRGGKPALAVEPPFVPAHQEVRIFVYSEPLVEEWIDLYQVAHDLRDLAPWEFMADIDLFAVEDPDDGRVGYCSVFGAGGEIFGLAVFPGALGYETFRRQASSKEHDFAEIDPAELMERLPYALMATFEDSSALDHRDRRLIRDLGLRYRGRNAWPMFRLHEPGYAPWFLGRDDVRFLTLVLEEAWGIALRMRENPDLLVPPDPRRPILMRRMVEGDFVDVWEAEPEPEPRDYPTLDYLELMGLMHASPRPTGATWEVDYFYLPSLMRESPRERPAFPRVAVWVDQASGLALGTLAGVGDKFLVDAPLQIFHAMLRDGTPTCIRARHADVVATILPIAEALGIRLEVSGSLPMLDEFKQELLQSPLLGGQEPD